MKLINILENDYWRQRVINSIPDIINSGHHNAKNYIDLENRISKSVCFTVLVDDDKMLAINGVFNGGIFASHVVRVADRTYYYNWKSGLASSVNKETRYSTNHIIPYHINAAREAGYKIGFISMQTPKKRNMLTRFTDPNYSPNIKFELLDGLYNTTPNTNLESPRSWQNIVVNYLTNERPDIQLPRIEIAEYYERYKDIKGIR
tara:strand:+ start:61 stop:672 length:612 start_codon:yes stop_codon:yes gene_type:complete